MFCKRTILLYERLTKIFHTRGLCEANYQSQNEVPYQVHCPIECSIKEGFFCMEDFQNLPYKGIISFTCIGSFVYFMRPLKCIIQNCTVNYCNLSCRDISKTNSLLFLHSQKPHQTFLDSMTLAVFEDSGWYKVNYDYAEDLPWATNQGCTYGLTEVCEGKETELFCNTRLALNKYKEVFWECINCIE